MDLNLMGDYYIWVKALHIITVIAWMAGLLYLPRLFVYHANAQNNSELSETLKIMERRLYYGIMMPSMLLSLLLGGFLSGIPGLIDYNGNDNWVWVKLFCIFILLLIHGLLGRWRRDFALDRNKHSPRFFKIINEVPTVIMIVIIIMVVVKPF